VPVNEAVLEGVWEGVAVMERVKLGVTDGV